MSAPISISIILCTCNRPAGLAESLAALAKLRIKPEWKAELLVVDNAPAETTASVVRGWKVENFEILYLQEPKKGKSNALNTGLARARGEIILFTDDDVIVPEDWVEQMVGAFERRQCDAVVGHIVLAAEMQRAWLTPLQKWWLAAPEGQPEESAELIGANMGFRKSVLKKVPGYDPELGPGSLGRGEESLFSAQLVEQGFKIAFARDAVVVHNPGVARLQRGEWLALSRKLGQQEAYLDYHWRHTDVLFPRLKRFWYGVKLSVRRVLQPPPPLANENCPAWESSYVRNLAMSDQFCIERRRARQYSRRGTVKRAV